MLPLFYNVMTFRLLFFSFLIFAPLGLLRAEPITIKNTKGQELTVTLQSLSGDKITFLNTSNSKSYTVPLSSLDRDSQATIKAWSTSDSALSTRFRVTVDMVKSNKKSKIEDYDDRVVVVTPKVTVKNMSPDKASTPLEAVMVVLGRPILKKKSMQVISKEIVQVPSLPKAGKQNIIYESAQILYDNKNAAQYGVRYYGHALLLVKDGQIIGGNYNPPSLERQYAGKLLHVTAGKTYKGDFSDVEEQ